MNIKSVKKTLLLKLNPKLTNWSDINVVLFVGTGRIGTGFFGKFYNDNFDETIGLHEPSPDLFHIGVGSFRKSLENKQIHKEVKKYRREVRKTLNKNGATNYVESNNNFTLLLKNDLRKIFPKLKIVFVTRHPLTYIKSAYSKHHSNKFRIFDENDVRDRLNSNDINSQPNPSWDKIDRFEKICWHWRNYNQLCLEAKEMYKEDFLTYKFEDLFSEDSENHLIDLTNQIGLSEYLKDDISLSQLVKKKANATNNFILDENDWTKDQIEAYTIYTQDLCRKLNYKN